MRFAWLVVTATVLLVYNGNVNPFTQVQNEASMAESHPVAARTHQVAVSQRHEAATPPVQLKMSLPPGTGY